MSKVENNVNKDKNILNFPGGLGNSSIRSNVHRNIIISFERKYLPLAQYCVTYLNMLDQRDKEFGIDNFYIEDEYNEPIN